MSERSLKAAGVRSEEIDLSGPTSIQPQGVPAAVIGTARKGRAFVPITFATVQDFESEFGRSDGKKFGPLAVYEWMRNAQAGTFVRVLGVGDGKERSATDGTVNKAGFIVGAEQVQASTKRIARNLHANVGVATDGFAGRTYFLGAYMSASAGSSIFTDAGLHASTANKAEPILRAVLMVPSGVIPTLSSSYRSALKNTPLSTQVAKRKSGADSGQALIHPNMHGSAYGDYVSDEFVLLLNGHKSSVSSKNILSASLNPRSSKHLSRIFNTDPYKIEEKGHYLYTYYDISSTYANVITTATKIKDYGAAAASVGLARDTVKCFILSGAMLGSTFDAASQVPNYENFEERYQAAKSPFVISQKFGSAPKNLLRFHAIDDGHLENLWRPKITIENIQASKATYDDYGTFDVIIRSFKDIDSDRVALEKYRGCNLDPTSESYICRKIGDRHMFYDFDRRQGSQKLRIEGLYPNRSAYVRVEVHPDVEAGITEKRAIPCGFRGAPHLLTRVEGVSNQILLCPVGGGPLDTVSNAANGLEARSPAESGVIGTAATDCLRPAGLARMVELPIPMREHLLKRGGKSTGPFTWGMQFERKTSLASPNIGKSLDPMIASLVKFFPQDEKRAPAPQVFGNEGTAKTNGVEYDCDVFNNNLFTLERVQVVTSSKDRPDATKWEAAVYKRSAAKATLTDKDGKTHSANHTRFLDPSKDFADATVKKYLSFTFTLFGGFDGNNMFNPDQQDMSDFSCRLEMEDPNRNGRGENTVASYRKAIDVLTEKSDTDIQLLAIPGLRHPAISDYAIDAVENRFDAMYIMDIEEEDLDNLVVTGSNIGTEGQLISVDNTSKRLVARNLDTSFAAVYFPDVVIQDPNTRTNVAVPPSVVALGAFSLNDRVGHPWFAPAGFARGRLESSIQQNVNLNQDNLDLLYGTDINPLRSHPQNPEAGIVIWGQKTLQQANSALDRVNVRRLLIDLRRKVKAVAHTFLFEPNREDTLAKFSAQVTPILANVQAQRGVSRFKVQIDTSTTSKADVENNTIRGKIYLQPVKSLEFVELSFVVANQGADI
jgi:hypothetical protein